MGPPNLCGFLKKEFPKLVDVLGESWTTKLLEQSQSLLFKYPHENLEGRIGDELENLPSVNNRLRDMFVDLFCYKFRPNSCIGPGGWVIPLLEMSLLYLSTKTSNPPSVQTAYRSDLRDGEGFIGTFHEVVCCARLARLGQRCYLHVPTGRRNFDIKVEGTEWGDLNADVKWRLPQWPVNYVDIVKEDGGNPEWEARGTVHPAFQRADKMNRPNKLAHPESDQIRRVLQDGLGQLPSAGLNLIIFCVSGTSRPFSMEDALLGDSFLLVDSRKLIEKAGRHPNGLFQEYSFMKISAVVRVELSCGEMKGRVHPNLKANTQFPCTMKSKLENVLKIQNE